MNKDGLKFLLSSWKLIIHLLLHTRKFGVNNQWFSEFNSIISQHHKGIRYILSNYREAKYRAVVIGFLDYTTCKNLGWIK